MVEESCPLQKNVLISGPPGIGKTTAIKKIVENLNGDAGGFYTEEIREGGLRKGFRLTTLDGERRILAHVGMQSRNRVGKYGVDLQAVELGVEAVQQAIRSGKLVIIDEIGEMELLSISFREAVLAAILNPQPLVATIRDASNPYCDFLKARSDVSVVLMNEENREEVPNQVMHLLKVYSAPNTSC